MRKIILSFLILLTVTLHLKAQTVLDYDVLTYNFNGTPVNGIKIKTNMPFTNGTQMPTLIIEGYNFGAASSMGLLLTYYVYENVFTRPGLSSYGAYTPPIYLANEGGKVVIFINSKDYYLRFSIRAFAKGMPAETAVNFEGWTTADEALSGTATAQLLVPYKNQFAGNVYLPGGIWNKDGNVGIGTTAPQSKLAVNGDLFAKRVKVTQTGWPDYVFAEDYKLPSLAEVAAYVREHKHLPDVPSAEEVEKEGLDVGEMNKRLLQKVEELTLYIIQLNKKNEALENRMSELEHNKNIK